MLKMGGGVYLYITYYIKFNSTYYPPCLTGLIIERERETKHKNQSTVMPLYLYKLKFSQLHNVCFREY